MEVLDSSIWEQKWNSGCVNGDRDKLSSFVCAYLNPSFFGSLPVPKTFLTDIGHDLPTMLLLKCKSVVWRVLYNPDLQQICKLRRFMNFYTVGVFYVLQFDYYGDGIFSVQIFNETGFEIKYPTISVVQFLETESAKEWISKNLTLEIGSAEYKKSASLFKFSTQLGSAKFFELDAIYLYQDDILLNPVLNMEMQQMCPNLEHGSKLFLSYCTQSWEIEIEMISGRYALGKGWSDFAGETQLSVNDVLIFYKLIGSSDNVLNVVIADADDYKRKKSEVTGFPSKRFFKIMTNEAIEREVVILPPFVKYSHRAMLLKVNKLGIAGYRTKVSYNSVGGIFKGFGDLMRNFNIRKDDLVIFRMDDTKIIHGRVYQQDGLELDYYKRYLNLECDQLSSCFFETELQPNLENEAGIIGAGSATQIYVDNSEYPQFLCVLEAAGLGNDIVLKVPDEFVKKFGRAIPSEIILELPNDIEISVRYNTQTQTITHLSVLLEECKNYAGSVLLFSYKDDGRFNVYILHEEGTEVEYIYRQDDGEGGQDKINGIGWKFFSRVDASTVEDGFIDIAPKFYQLFRREIDASVLYALPNGDLISGRYYKRDKRLAGLLDAVNHGGIEVDDIVMFTYWGAGKFDILPFRLARKHEPLVDEAVQNEPENNDATAQISEDEMVDPENNNAGADVIEHGLVDEHPEEQVNDNPEEFIIILTKSNVDKKSHGVYIPKDIKPHNREWAPNERITLRTTNGDWSVGLTSSGGMVRCSAGWNKFARDNKLRFRQRLTWIKLPDEENGVVFDVLLA